MINLFIKQNFQTFLGFKLSFCHLSLIRTQILDEFSQKNGLGTPIYQLHSTVGGAGGDVQLFLFKVGEQ
jgi:hypothetical protein